MQFNFSGELIEWRGPAPFYFVAMPVELTPEVKEIARILSYGWGCIPVDGTLNGVAFHTALIPKDGRYMVPIKNAVRLPAKLTLGQPCEITLSFNS